jgi:hypothetical protein
MTGQDINSRIIKLSRDGQPANSGGAVSLDESGNRRAPACARPRPAVVQLGPPTVEADGRIVTTTSVVLAGACAPPD